MVRGPIGVLALQGAFAEHIAALERLGVKGVAIRLPKELKGLEGLIVPGGESTTIGLLMQRYGLLEPVQDVAQRGLPIWGTCAGMILMARGLMDQEQPLLGLMDIVVLRNAFGRQVDSFEKDLDIPSLGAAPFRAVFIRAPLIIKTEKGVEVLARLPKGGIVAARQGNLLATAFHPELTHDLRFHRYFLDLGDSQKEPRPREAEAESTRT